MRSYLEPLRQVNSLVENNRRYLVHELNELKNANELMVNQNMQSQTVTSLNLVELGGIRQRLASLYESMKKLYKIKKIQTFFEAFVSH
jgi:hypothetical protein